MKKSYH